MASVGETTLTNSNVSGNHTIGELSSGGALYAQGSLTLSHSTVSGNYTTGKQAGGGGISNAPGAVHLIASTVSGNKTTGQDSDGDGIFCFGQVSTVILTDSTVSGNRALGADSSGGGIYNRNVQATNSIVAGNSAHGAGARHRGHPHHQQRPQHLRQRRLLGNDGRRPEGVGRVALLPPSTRPLAAACSPTMAARPGASPCVTLVNNPALGGDLDGRGGQGPARRGCAPRPTGTEPDVGAFELSPDGGQGRSSARPAGTFSRAPARTT